MPVLQPHNSRNCCGLGYSVFARHYWRNHYCFLFLQLLRCFSSLGLLLYVEILRLHRSGLPHSDICGSIRITNPRSLSQLITSFIASESLGILHTLLLTSCSTKPNFYVETMPQHKRWVLVFLSRFCFYNMSKNLTVGCAGLFYLHQLWARSLSILVASGTSPNACSKYRHCFLIYQCFFKILFYCVGVDILQW